MDKSSTSPGPPRILIVEDEVLVRMFAVDALEDAGFQVEEADSATAALQSIERAPTDISAVVVDLGLPDRPGDQLAADLRALRAELPIVIASGRSEHELKDRFSSDRGFAILVKPYTASLLVEALTSLGVTP